MKISAIQNQNVSFGSVKAVTYPKSYNSLMKNDLQYKRLFDKSVDKLKEIKTNLKDLIGYNELSGKEKLYADTLLSKVSDEEKEDLTIKLELCNNGYDGKYKNSRGYMKIYFPNLSKEWDYPTEDGVGVDYVFYDKNDSPDLKDENYYFFFGKLPMPTPKYLKQALRLVLSDLSEELYNETQRQKHGCS